MMKVVYILKNQQNLFLDKAGDWVGGELARQLYRTEFKDEAINRKVEFSVKNTEVRIEIIEALATASGDIQLPEALCNLMDSAENTHQSPTTESPTAESPANDSEDDFALTDDDDLHSAHSL